MANTSPANKKQHVSIVICGHVDAGKSTTTGRLIFELKGISEREMTKLKDEAKAQGKESFAFAFYMDGAKEERARGVTINCTTKQFHTESYHYTIIDAPGHRDFIKNMVTGASQADVGLLMVPADGNFVASIAKGNHKAGQIQGQTRQHARLLKLLGVKQLIVGVNKMDSDVAKYGEERFKEIRDEVASMLVKVGWKKDFVTNCVPILPISGWKGDNLITKSTNMDWFKGIDVKVGDDKVHVHTLLDALENMVKVPKRSTDAKLRMPVSSILKLNGIGDVVTGRVEQGTVKPDDTVIFLPTHTKSNPCTGKVFSVEMHNKSAPSAGTGDHVGLNIKGLKKENMPKAGDVMILEKDDSLKRCKSFTAQVQVLDIPNRANVGYSPVAFVRTGRSAVKVTAIKWKRGKETGGQKVDNPEYLIANEIAEVVFEPKSNFVVENFKTCEGLGRIAIMERNSVVMLGAVTAVTYAE